MTPTTFSTNRTRILATVFALAAVCLVTTPAAGHPHVVTPSSHDQAVAGGQNHPGFQPINDDGLRLSCAGTLEPPDAGPAGYGLETAHHGPDAGVPGKADGCYAVVGDPEDDNPALD